MADNNLFGLESLKVGMIYPELGNTPLTAAEAATYAQLGSVSSGELKYLKNLRANDNSPAAEIPKGVNTYDLNKVLGVSRQASAAASLPQYQNVPSQVPSVLAQQGNVQSAVANLPGGGAVFGTMPSEQKFITQNPQLAGTQTAATPSAGLDIDKMLQEYLTGLTTGNVEARKAQESAVQSQYEQAAQKIGASVGQGRRTLDTGGYQSALMEATKNLETQRITQLAQIADTYNQLLQQGYGTAAGVATTLRGQDLSEAEAKRRLDLTGQQLSQEYELQKAAQALQTKQFEESLKQFEKTYGLQLQSSPYAMAQLQRSYELKDRPYYEDLAKRTAANYAPSFQEQLMGMISGGAQIYANLSNPYAALLGGK